MFCFLLFYVNRNIGVASETLIFPQRKHFYLFIFVLRDWMDAVSQSANQFAAGGLMTFDNQFVAFFSFENPISSRGQEVQSN